MNDMSTSASSNKGSSQPLKSSQQLASVLLNVHMIVVVGLVIASIISTLLWIANSDHTSNSIFTIVFLILTFDATVIGVIYGNSRIDEKLEKLALPAGLKKLSIPAISQKSSRLRLFLTLMFLPVVLASSIFIGFAPPPPVICKPLAPGTSCIIQTTGENIAGLSNGVSAFDIKRKDGQLKLDAFNEYNANNISAASSSLQRAITIDPTDAEARIDQENLRAMNSYPTWSIIVGADIVSDSTQWKAITQGAYTAQKHFNRRQDLPNNLKIVLLLANFGGDQTPNVVRLIGQAVQTDNLIIGMVDWPGNSVTDKEMQTLNQEKLPIVLSTTESENIPGAYQYAFLVAATTKQEGVVGAKFAMQILHAQNVVIVMDNDDPYSNSLGTAFSTTFLSPNAIPTIQYQVGDTKNMPQLLKIALSYHPDLIYFAGNAHDTNAFLSNPAAFVAAPEVNILASDSVYDLPLYPKGALNRLYYTASAFEDMYRYRKLSQPHIFCEYTSLFAKSTVGEDCDQSKTYWSDRASSDTTLAMDAMALLIQAIKQVGYQSSLTPIAVEQALWSMSQHKTSFQGVSGCISLGPDRKPDDNKNVVVLHVDASRDTHIVYQQGCLTAPTQIMSLFEKQVP